MKIEKYGRRNWAVYAPNGELIAVTVYKKGAAEVARLLAAVKERRRAPRKANPATRGWVILARKAGRQGYYRGMGGGFDPDMRAAARFLTKVDAQVIAGLMGRNHRDFPGVAFSVEPIFALLPGGKNPVKNPATLTRKQAEKLKAEGHVVAIYPRKKEVCVDGFKYFKLIGEKSSTKKRVRTKNPVPPSSKARLNAAIKLYEEFTGHSPDNIDRVSVPAVDTALAIGDCHAVIYGCVRDGKHEQYIHEFQKQARPLLASSYDGQSLLLLGGGFQFTDRGIVDD